MFNMAPGEDESLYLLNDPTMELPTIECCHGIDVTLVQNGTITSPGYPDNYSAFLNCKWKIKGTPGKKILAAFMFRKFDIIDC